MFFSTAAARVRVATLLGIDTLLKLAGKPAPRPDRVLIVRLDAIGDFILWMDAAKAIVRHYKGRGRTAVLVANNVWASWAKNLGIFEEVIPVDVYQFHHDPLYRFRTGRQIRRWGCTIAVEPSYSRSWLLGDSVIRVSGANERIGSAGNTSEPQTHKQRISDRWYTRLIPADPLPLMELERNAEFVRNLGEAGFHAALPQLPETSLLEDNAAFIAATAGKPFYVLFPGASWEGRRWPVSGFHEIAERLYNRTGWLGVVCGGGSDREIAGELCARSISPLVNWAGRTTLGELAAILNVARLLLTNETSAVHIGAACGTPTVCLLGGGHYGRFLPYQIQGSIARPLPQAVIHKMPCFGCNWQCIYPRPEGGPVPCIEQIDTEEVWQAVSEVLCWTE